MILRLASCVFLLVASGSTGAVVVAIPSAPLSSQDIHIQVVNQYFVVASIASESITRSGNQFLISQTVNLSCALPSAATTTSDFDVGALPAGTYQVVAQIQRIGLSPGCGGFTSTQSASFLVSDPATVPVGNTFGYLISACLLAYFAARKLRTSGRSENG
jgi:hypothetical protein